VPVTLESLTFDQLADRLESDGVSRAHTQPLYRWLQTGERGKFERPLERWIEARAAEEFTTADQVAETPSSDGLTRKFLLRLADGAEVESVLMGFPGRFTACLSTQVGCAMGCVFCATGQMGFRRHLKAAEIVAQAKHVAAELQKVHGEKLRNLVMMGMGEPLHNFDETMLALDHLTETRGMGIGPSRVSISTVGHVDGIRRLAEYPKRYTLAVSLHGATDEERSRLIPINRRWPLAELMQACRDYSERKGQRVLIAWTLIGGVNDSDEHAARLAALLDGMHVQVNLIPLNTTEGFDGKPPEDQRVSAFQRILQASGLPVTVRQKRGLDVAAGCGQLSTQRSR
jgi:23S rRNA (adenine2503-C2)-methyltransferase